MTRPERPANDRTWALAGLLLSSVASGCVQRPTTRVPAAIGPTLETRSVPGLPVTGVETAVQLAADVDVTCARLAAGDVACWGHGLGPSRTAVTRFDFEPVMQVAVSRDLLCGRTARGAIECIGYGPPETGEAARLALGRAHACMVRRDWRVACSHTSAAATAGPWFMIEGVADVQEVAARGDRTCARSGGGVYCWNAGDAVAVRVEGLDDAVEVAVGGEHACARRRGGAVVCWGDNRRGQLGERTAASSSARPVAVAGIAESVQIAAGGAHTCALQGSGALVCWGDGSSGQLGGPSSPAPARRPVRMDLADVVEVAAGERHTCARLQGGGVTCWGGDGDERVLGSGPAPSPASVPPVAGLGEVRQLTLGWHHRCARDGAGHVSCWGRNHNGELGDGTTADHAEPARVPGLAEVVDISAHDTATCALRGDGEIVCWGGLSTRGPKKDQSVVPSRVMRETGAIDIELGGQHGCVLTRDGIVKCWGCDIDHALGVDIDQSCAYPAQVAGLDDAAQLSVSGHETCVLRRTGQVVCWGSVQDPVDTERGALPEPVSGLVDVVEVRTGTGFACARHRGGTVSCWSRFLPLPHGDDRRVAPFVDRPVPVPGITDAVELDADEHVCVRRATGAVLCWGDNEHGQLGDGTTMTRRSPTPVLGLDDAVEVALHARSTCVRRSSGGVVCWGDSR